MGLWAYLLRSLLNRGRFQSLHIARCTPRHALHPARMRGFTRSGMECGAQGYGQGPMPMPNAEALCRNVATESSAGETGMWRVGYCLARAVVAHAFPRNGVLRSLVGHRAATVRNSINTAPAPAPPHSLPAENSSINAANRSSNQRAGQGLTLLVIVMPSTSAHAATRVLWVSPASGSVERC